MRQSILAFLLASTAALAHADLRVFATVPEWGALAREIGGEHVKVFVATQAMQDPHRIEARPSLLAQARQAQFVVAVGAELEQAWLPLVLRDSGNAAIQPGRPAYFEAALQVQRLGVLASADRAQGDVHAAGNPHVHLDPHNVLRVGEALAARMAELDPAQATSYQASFKVFAGKWQLAIGHWEKEAAALRGTPVLVHHASFQYLSQWLGLSELGALEPKPGIEPTSSHLASLLARQQVQPARLVLRTPYQPEGPSQWIAGRSGMSAVLLPYTVGGTPEANDLFGLFDDTIRRLRKGLP